MLTDKQAKEIETKVVPLTLQIAKHFDRMNTLKGDRDPETPKGRARIAWLYGLLRAGLFHSPEWSYVILLPKRKGGKKIKFRMDGGHSSRMLVESGVDFPEKLMVMIRVFEAETMDEVIELYEQFNPGPSTRTITDLVKNRSSYESGLEEISPSNIKQILFGIICHLRLRKPYAEYELLDLIRPNASFILWCSEFISAKKLKKPGVVGVIYETYHYDKEAALDFWRKVRDDVGIDLKFAPRTLAQFLHDETLKNKKASTTIKWDSRAYYVKCIHAWNAWRKGEATNLKYHPKADIPKLI